MSMSAQAHIESTAEARPEADGRALRMAALVRRLAERKRLEREIERLERELEPDPAPAPGRGRIQALVARVFAARRRAAGR